MKAKIGILSEELARKRMICVIHRDGFNFLS